MPAALSSHRPTTACQKIRRSAVPIMAGPVRSMDSHGSSGGRIIAAAAERNKTPLLEVLSRYLAPLPGGTVLEMASGTGQHAAHLAAALPQLTWQPSETATELLDSIAAWTDELPNVQPPLLLDAAQPDTWAVEDASCAAVLCVNMTHISPWASTQGLVAGAGRVSALPLIARVCVQRGARRGLPGLNCCMHPLLLISM